jgi:hypothetical protein
MVLVQATCPKSPRTLPINGLRQSLVCGDVALGKHVVALPLQRFIDAVTCSTSPGLLNFSLLLGSERRRGRIHQ